MEKEFAHLRENSKTVNLLRSKLNNKKLTIVTMPGLFTL